MKTEINMIYTDAVNDKKMRKKINTLQKIQLSNNFESPIDNLFFNLSNSVSPYLEKLNYTANGITTLSTIFYGASLYHLYRHELVPFTIYVILGYFFGTMGSNGSKLYGNFKNLIFIIGYIYILYKRYDIMEFPVLILMVSCLAILCLLFIGCKESIIEENSTFGIGKMLMSLIQPDNKKCVQYMQYLKFFGPATLFFIVIYVTWLIECTSGLDNSSDGEHILVDIKRPIGNSFNDNIHLVVNGMDYDDSQGIIKEYF